MTGTEFQTVKTALYPGVCPRCRGRFVAGTPIARVGQRWGHVGCSNRLHQPPDFKKAQANDHRQEDA